tara:strand:- start:2199 stop:2498 length:300 start_codon:yes stop_codon:yes gene_type:complete
MSKVTKTTNQVKVAATKATSKKAVKPVAKPTVSKATPAKPKAKATTTRSRNSKKLYRLVSIKKLTELYGEDGAVLCSANAVEGRQLEILKDKAQLELAL